MSYDSVKNSDGSDWYKYYRCPSTWWTTKCYVTCGVNEFPEYLQRVQTQAHPCYRNIGPERFVSTSSVKNVTASSSSGSMNRHVVTLRKFS